MTQRKETYEERIARLRINYEHENLDGTRYEEQTDDEDSER